MKAEYTPMFEQFWKLYPRKTAKSVAARAWAKHVDEQDAFMVKAITDNLEKRTRLKWWPTDTTKIPHAATWINQGRYLDEGWEDDIKTRGYDHNSKVPKPFVPRADHMPEVSQWEVVLNKIFVRYIRASGGLKEIKKAENIKHEVLRQNRKAMDEELANGTKYGECALLIADLFLARLDADLGLNLKGKVIK
jgi:hypothetical protein